MSAIRGLRPSPARPLSVFTVTVRVFFNYNRKGQRAGRRTF